MKKVAIIGRPNTGKSTLFNRLTGKKRSITDPHSGVTRDLVTQECFLCGENLLLIDTGGIMGTNEGVFDEQIKQKSISALRTADAVLFMVTSEGETPEDSQVLDLVRPFADKTILVVNKADTTEKVAAAWSFASWGFERLFPISATHALGLGEMLDALEILLETCDESEEAIEGATLANESEQQAAEGEGETVKIALVGRPNTGKSTLLNKLCGQELSIVSPLAGTTRDVIEGTFSFKSTPIRVLDTAGIRKKGKVSEDIEYYSVNRAIKAIEECDVAIIMIEASSGVTDQDKKIAQLAVSRGCAIVLAINKTDTFTIKNQLEASIDRLRFVFPLLSWAPVVGISAKNGVGIDKLLDEAIKANSERNKRIDTPTLNKCLIKWQRETPPPRNARGLAYKIKYGTQISVAPVRFLLFVNRMEDFPSSYITFIKNKIKTELGYKRIPIEVLTRANTEQRSKLTHKKSD